MTEEKGASDWELKEGLLKEGFKQSDKEKD